MTRFILLCIVCAISVAPPPSYASAGTFTPTVSAARLDRMCHFYRQSLRGMHENPDAARQCDMYLQGMIDTMRIHEKLSGTRLFCSKRTLTPPDILPALELWIRKNPEKSENATAAVALLDALRVGYPCPR